MQKNQTESSGSFSKHRCTTVIFESSNAILQQMYYSGVNFLQNIVKNITCTKAALPVNPTKLLKSLYPNAVSLQRSVKG